MSRYQLMKGDKRLGKPRNSLHEVARTALIKNKSRYLSNNHYVVEIEDKDSWKVFE